MAHSFKRKISTLQKILNNQVKYSIVYKKITVHVDGKFIRYNIERINKKANEYPLTKSVTVKDIDKIIVQERSKLHNMRTRTPELDSAIKELEFIDTLKDIIK